MANGKRVLQLSRESKALTQKIKWKYDILKRAPSQNSLIKIKK